MSMSRRLEDRSVFDRRHGPAVTASGDGQEGAYSAILNTSPSNGTVQVIVPNLWGLTTARTAACSTSFVGTPGEQVLVVFDEAKQPWVVSPPSTLPPSGPAGGVLTGTYPNPTFAALTWTALPYNTGWTDFATNYRPGEYATDGNRVWVRGQCKNTVAYAFSGTNNVIFTMPTALRPPTNKAQIYKLMARDGNNNYSVVSGEIVDSSGQFIIFAAVGTNGGTVQNTAVPFISFDGVYWDLT